MRISNKPKRWPLGFKPHSADARDDAAVERQNDESFPGETFTRKRKNPKHSAWGRSHMFASRLIFIRQEYGRGRSIGLCEHPNPHVSGRAVRAQDPVTMCDGEVILALVLFRHLSPVPGLVALDKFHGRLTRLCQCFNGAACHHELTQQELQGPNNRRDPGTAGAVPSHRERGCRRRCQQWPQSLTNLLALRMSDEPQVYPTLFDNPHLADDPSGAIAGHGNQVIPAKRLMDLLQPGGCGRRGPINHHHANQVCRRDTESIAGKAIDRTRMPKKDQWWLTFAHHHPLPDQGMFPGTAAVATPREPASLQAPAAVWVAGRARSGLTGSWAWH